MARMTTINRDLIEQWIQELNISAHICPDCEGIHFSDWEAKDAVLESRCFVESDRCSLLTEISIRPSAVLPLQGAVHFMNYDYSYVKVMISLSDHDVPRLLLTHAVPKTGLTEELFQAWMTQLLDEVEGVYKQLTEMEVLLIEEEGSPSEFDDQLH